MIIDENPLAIRVIKYQELLNESDSALKALEISLQKKGIVAISEIPNYANLMKKFFTSAQEFSNLSSPIKQRYSPIRELNPEVGGYEIGTEKFQDAQGNWHIDDEKASYYALIPDQAVNVWPQEIDIKTHYLALGELIFTVGKKILQALKIDASAGIAPEELIGYGRMLHYKKSSATDCNHPIWCGAHYDHGVLTGLTPSIYFQDGVEVPEPSEAGLYIVPNDHAEFQKVSAHDRSICFFQVGEFAQLASHDKINATKHLVKKAFGEIERYTFAVFLTPTLTTNITSTSKLISDERYANYKNKNGSIVYKDWHEASLSRYLVK